MRIGLIILFFTCLLVFSAPNADAQSPYTLPYPAAMPGNKVYLLQKLQEKVIKYWFFGDFGQYYYHVKYADRYLVEAKTLFEYKQYLLAYRALEKSNEYYKNIEPILTRASKKEKNISDKLSTFKNISLKHIEVLDPLILIVPKEFTWTPEKNPPTHLPIHQLIKDSISMRKKLL